jgi:ankyrin repeat protein
MSATTGDAMPTDGDYLKAFSAIRAGDVTALAELLSAHRDLATSRLNGRTPLHVVTDWPGYFPHGPQIAQLLIDTGAEVDARGADGTGETPLHWAASSDDADVARVLIDAGADIEAPDGSIGTPLDNAIGYGCWNVARLLVARGAKVDKLWHAAALGLTDRLVELLADPGCDQDAINQAFWHACAGGQRRAAALLLDRGADLTFTPDYGHGSVLDVARNHGTQQTNLIEWLEQLGVRP